MSESFIKKLDGMNGQLEVYNNKVVITRKGILAKLNQGLFKGEKTIYIRQITGIQVKQAGFMVSGYIQFTISGGIEGRRGIFEATKDENTVVFTKPHNSLVKEIQDFIEQKMENPVQTSNSSLSIAEEIRQLKQLLDDGIISESEFNKKKSNLLK